MIKLITQVLKEIKYLHIILTTKLSEENFHILFENAIKLIDISVIQVRHNKKYTKLSTNYLNIEAPTLVESFEKYQNGKKEYLQINYKQENLAKMPTNTFGYEYSEFIKVLPPIKPVLSENTDLLGYYKARLLLTHDMLHILLGADANIYGETATFGFYCGQFFNPLSLIFLNILEFKATRSRDLMACNYLVDAFCQGYVIGKQATDISGVIFEEEFEEDLETLRLKYRISRIIPPLDADTILPFKYNRINNEAIV